VVKKEQQIDSDQSLSESLGEVKTERKSESDLYRENRELKGQLKNAMQAQRELKLLLDMFKSVDKEKRYELKTHFIIHWFICFI
jgi:hypothetical protein